MQVIIQSILLQYSHGRICQLMYLKMKKPCQQVYCSDAIKLRIECMPWQYPMKGLYFDIDSNIQLVFCFIYGLLQVRRMSFYMFIWNYVGSSRALIYSQKFGILNISVNCNQSSFRVASSIFQVSNFFLTISIRGLFQFSLTRQQLDPLIQMSCKSNQYHCTSLTVNLELDSFTLYLSNFDTAYQTNPHSANKLLDTVSLSKDLIICENLLYWSRKSRIGVCYYYPCILSIYYYIIFRLLSYLVYHFSLLLTCILIYLSIPMFRYRLAPNFAYTKVRLAVGQMAVEAMVPPHPLFSQVRQIQLKNDETNLKCLELLQKGEVQIAIQNSTEFVKRCREVYNLNPQIVTEEVGLNLLLSNGDEGNKTLEILQFNDLLAMLKTAFDSTGTKLHSKIMRKIKSYIKTSKRKSSEKEVLQKIIKSYKQDQKIEQDQQEQVKEQKKPQNKPQLKKKQSLKTSKPSYPKPKQENIQIEEQDEQTSQKISSHQARRKQRIDRKQQQQLKPTVQQFQDFAENDEEVNPKGRGRDNRMRQSKSRNNRSKDGYQGRGGVSKEKRFDPKIMLGISGDTEAGWRQRNRPPRVPARPIQEPYQERQQKYENKQYQTKQYKKQENRRYDNENPRTRTQPQSQPQYQKQKQKQQQVSQSSASRQIKSNSKTGLLFTFPKDGQNFDFSQIQQSFKLFINGSFWVNYNNGVLQIIKGSNGYRRDSKIDVISNGFMAEGLTLSLSGHSNIQDGGEAIGNPSIQEFTGNQSQFFPVVTMDVYSYDSKLSENTQSENSATVQNQIQKQKKVDNKLNKKQQDAKKQQKFQNANKKDNQTLKVPKKAVSPKKGQDEQQWEDVSEGASSSMQPQPQKQQQQQQIQQVQQTPAPKAKQQQTRQSRRQKKSGGDNKYKSYKGKQHLGDEEELYPDKRSRSRGSNSSRGSRGSRGSGQGKGREVKLDKSKIDPMIMLGINGDSEEGWRRKQRPEKHSKRNNDREQNKKDPKTELRKKSEQTTKKEETNKQKQQSHSKPQKSQSKEAQKQSEHMDKSIPEEAVSSQHSEVAQKHKALLVSKVDNNPPIFTYHKDGQNFDFSKLKNGFKLYINKSFWVKYSNRHLEIKKGNDAYIRQCDIDFIQNGFMGQGLTVRLGDSCNLQDGGEIQGNPSIRQFTGNQTQFFYVNSMQVYPF